MVKLGGREFDIISSGTLEWDVTLLNLLQGCGLADVTLHAGETAEGLALRIYRTLMASGAVFEILGCVLIPSGTDPFAWRPSDMKLSADFIRALHDPADKAVITSQITTLVASFFQQGLISARTLPSFSTLPNVAPNQPEVLPGANTITSLANGQA